MDNPFKSVMLFTLQFMIVGGLGHLLIEIIKNPADYIDGWKKRGE